MNSLDRESNYNRALRPQTLLVELQNTGKPGQATVINKSQLPYTMKPVYVNVGFERYSRVGPINNDIGCK